MQYLDASVGFRGKRFPNLVDVAVNPAERRLDHRAIWSSSEALDLYLYAKALMGVKFPKMLPSTASKCT